MISFIYYQRGLLFNLYIHSSVLLLYLCLLKATSYYIINAPKHDITEMELQS